MVQDWQFTTSQVSSEDYSKDRWAYRMLHEYADIRRKLRSLYREYTKRIDEGEEVLCGDREWIGSMLNELTEVIPMIAAHCAADQLGVEERRWVERLRRAAYGKKTKTRPWDPEWIQRLRIPDPHNWVDELIDRLDGRTEEEEVQFTYDFGLSPRQQQVLEAMSAGCSYGQVARESGLKKGTISRHLRLARKKCQGKLVAQLAWKFE